MSFTEDLYGKEFADKKQLFESKLEGIEKKYEDWFKPREPKMPREEYDRLHNHHILNWDAHGIRFGFRNDSEVPKHIQDECSEVFNEVFGNSKT